MALILNIETSAEICSVALANKLEILSIKESHHHKQHSSLLTVFINKIFAENHIEAADLDAIAVSKGPGSYTGLRIGVSVSKGLCYGADKPLISVGTLEIMANRFITGNIYKEYGIDNLNDILLCPMIDARRMEVYTAFFQKDLSIKHNVSADILDAEAYNEFLETQKVCFFGNGMKKFKEIKTHKNAIFVDDIIPHAKDMISLSYGYYSSKKFEDVAYFEPYYLKEFITTTPVKNKF